MTPPWYHLASGILLGYCLTMLALALWPQVMLRLAGIVGGCP